MPIYEYQCAAGHIFDAYATVAARHDPRLCRCGAACRKVILHAPRVFGDYEGYESPASGKWIEGRRARSRDFEETGTRPYEAGEKEAMLARQSANDRKLDAFADEAVESTLHELTR